MTEIAPDTWVVLCIRVPCYKGTVLYIWDLKETLIWRTTHLNPKPLILAPSLPRYCVRPDLRGSFCPLPEHTPTVFASHSVMDS